MKAVSYIIIALTLPLTSHLSLCHNQESSLLEHVSILKEHISNIEHHTLRLREQFDHPNGFFYQLQALIADFKRLTYTTSSSRKQSIALANSLGIVQKLNSIDSQSLVQLADLLLSIAQGITAIIPVQKALVRNNYIPSSPLVEPQSKLLCSLQNHTLTLAHTVAQAQPKAEAIITSLNQKNLASIISKLNEDSMDQLNDLSRMYAKLYDLTNQELKHIMNLNSTIAILEEHMTSSKKELFSAQSSLLLRHFVPIMNDAVSFARRSIVAGATVCRLLQKPATRNQALAETVKMLIQDTKELEALLQKL
jgi:hypothetical protein